MLSVFNLVLPFFGLIFLGFLVARISRQPLEALGWMNVFIVYVALPALFFQILSKTPVAELTQWAFIIGCTASTLCVFLVMFGFAFFQNAQNRRKHHPRARRRLWQYRLYGAGIGHHGFRRARCRTGCPDLLF